VKIEVLPYLILPDHRKICKEIVLGLAAADLPASTRNEIVSTKRPFVLRAMQRMTLWRSGDWRTVAAVLEAAESAQHARARRPCAPAPADPGRPEGVVVPAEGPRRLADAAQISRLQADHDLRQGQTKACCWLVLSPLLCL